MLLAELQARIRATIAEAMIVGLNGLNLDTNHGFFEYRDLECPRCMELHVSVPTWITAQRYLLPEEHLVSLSWEREDRMACTLLCCDITINQWFQFHSDALEQGIEVWTTSSMPEHWEDYLTGEHHGESR